MRAQRREEARLFLWRNQQDLPLAPCETNGDPVPYLPPDKRGMLGPLSAQQILYLKKQLMRSLVKRMPRELAVKILQALFPEPAR